MEMKVERSTEANPYHFDRCGLDYIYLIGIERLACPRCGASYPIIPRMAELHRVIAGIVIEKPAELSGQEVRYLRSWIGVQAKEFAKWIGCDPAYLSRIENGHHAALGESADKLVRVYAMTHKEKMAAEEISERLQRASKRRKARQRCFRFVGQRWREQNEEAA
jgi:DNA-binding transcriptional regulator YiaG